MKSLFGVLKYKKINKETLEEIEELLIRSDVDLETSKNLIDELSTKGIMKYLIPKDWLLVITFFKTLIQ